VIDAPVPVAATDLGRANYAALWDAVAAAVPDRPAVVAGGRTIPYRELADAAAGASAWTPRSRSSCTTGSSTS